MTGNSWFHCNAVVWNSHFNIFSKSITDKNYNLSMSSFESKNLTIFVTGRSIKGTQDCECHFGEGAAVSQAQTKNGQNRHPVKYNSQTDRQSTAG